MTRRPPRSPLFPYATLFPSVERGAHGVRGGVGRAGDRAVGAALAHEEVAVVERVADGDARLVRHPPPRPPSRMAGTGGGLSRTIIEAATVVRGSSPSGRTMCCGSAAARWRMRSS